MSGPLTPELRLLRALDELRDAMADVLAQRAAPAGPPPLLTMTATAHRLGVARSTVTRWADSGRLRTIGPTHARRVPASELERLAGNGTASPVDGGTPGEAVAAEVQRVGASGSAT